MKVANEEYRMALARSGERISYESVGGRADGMDDRGAGERGKGVVEEDVGGEQVTRGRTVDADLIYIYPLDACEYPCTAPPSLPWHRSALSEHSPPGCLRKRKLHLCPVRI